MTCYSNITDCNLSGNPLFNVRGIFNKECPEVARFQEMGVQAEVVEISDK